MIFDYHYTRTSLLSRRTHPFAIAVCKGPELPLGSDLVVDEMLEGSLGSDYKALTQSFLK